MSDKPSCGSCRFFGGFNKDRAGPCQFNPPVLQSVRYAQMSGGYMLLPGADQIWPEVWPHMVCSKHEHSERTVAILSGAARQMQQEERET